MAWPIDPAHSQIMFTVLYMIISNVRGRFEKFDGVGEFNEQHPTRSKVEIQNVVLETGRWVVSDEVNITIELEIVKQAEATLEELEEEVA